MTLMLARRGRVVFRYLTSRAPFVPGNAQLVAIAANNVSPVLSSSCSLNGPLPIILKNSYASAAGRPKGHTGRAAASKKPKAKAEATGTKNKAKKTKAGKTAKPKPKAKAKAKPKPKAKSKSKRLTEKQKEDLEKKKEKEQITALKAAALTPPKRLPSSRYAIFNQEKHAFGPENLETYKNLSSMERERLGQVAESNLATYKASFASWVKSFTPLQIKEANEARKKLRRKFKTKKQQFPIIPDERQVRRPKSGYMMFCEELNNSGDLANLKVAERGAEAGQRWKRLTESEKEKYKQMGKKDTQRYYEEHKTIYGTPPKSSSASTPRSSESPI